MIRWEYYRNEGRKQRRKFELDLIKFGSRPTYIVNDEIKQLYMSKVVNKDQDKNKDPLPSFNEMLDEAYNLAVSHCVEAVLGVYGVEKEVLLLIAGEVGKLKKNNILTI